LLEGGIEKRGKKNLTGWRQGRRGHRVDGNFGEGREVTTGRKKRRCHIQGQVPLLFRPAGRRKLQRRITGMRSASLRAERGPTDKPRLKSLGTFRIKGEREESEPGQRVLDKGHRRPTPESGARGGGGKAKTESKRRPRRGEGARSSKRKKVYPQKVKKSLRNKDRKNCSTRPQYKFVP